MDCVAKMHFPLTVQAWLCLAVIRPSISPTIFRRYKKLGNLVIPSYRDVGANDRNEGCVGRRKHTKKKKKKTYKGWSFANPSSTLFVPCTSVQGSAMGCNLSVPLPGRTQLVDEEEEEEERDPVRDPQLRIPWVRAGHGAWLWYPWQKPRRTLMLSGQKQRLQHEGFATHS